MDSGIRLATAVSIAFVAMNAVAQVPSVDSLAGRWLSGDEIVNPPSVTSTLGTLGCTENLTGFHYCEFPPIAQGGEAAVLYVDGKPAQASRFRWLPYGALREGTTASGLKLASEIRLAAHTPRVLVRLRIENPTQAPISASLELQNPAGFRSCPGVWDWSNRGVDPSDGFDHRRPNGQGETIHDSKSGVDAVISGLRHETIELAPGRSQTFEIACSLDGRTLGFEKEFDGAKRDWESRWRDAFTPGNRRYSGNFPTLVTRDEKLARVYYLALMTMLQMERTAFPHSPRCFVTVGPQYGTTLEYFWDTALFSTIYSLLDPASFRRNLDSWLSVDIHRHYAIDYLTGEGVGPWYAPNDFSVFTAFWNYGTTTGDSAFMNEIRPRFVDWAEAWKKRVRPGETLADFGDNDNILECGPAYVNMIPSLNAAHVGIMRKAALLCPPEQAASLRSDASRLAKAVLGQYVPGDGVWRTKHRDGKEVVCRHVYDYLTIGLSMTDDLSPQMKREMTGFVDRELLADGWIRAMSLSDEAAPISDRPDHGPKGSYCAWPALAALTMFEFGQPKDAESLVERCEGATWQGPFPQAFELLQVPGTNRWIPRISLRGADYNETSGAAFAETVIHGLFGIEFNTRGEVRLSRPAEPRPVEAKLLNVRTKNGLRSFACDRRGVRPLSNGAAASGAWIAVRLG
ncbi:MAG TPA: hypothetical protein VMI31_19155 [Fimbriimonadaceae bacterium]|nr:hypothetical protein [Fimbriimonadaceae bacterium]